MLPTPLHKQLKRLHRRASTHALIIMALARTTEASTEQSLMRTHSVRFVDFVLVAAVVTGCEGPGAILDEGEGVVEEGAVAAVVVGGGVVGCGGEVCFGEAGWAGVAGVAEVGVWVVVVCAGGAAAAVFGVVVGHFCGDDGGGM